MDGGFRVTAWRKKATIDVVKDVVKEPIELTERQALIYKTIKENVVKDVVITASTLSERFSVDERTIQRDLNELQKRGFIAREGGRKGGKWIIKL